MTERRIAQQTRAGGRPYNQDRLGSWQTPEAALIVLADGMGGHANGDVAAQLVVEHLGAEFERAARPRLRDPDLFLYRRIGSAHALLGRAARARGFEEVPRTTIAACVVQGGRAYWMHVGDSRVYHLRGTLVLERTKDHTRVQKLLDEGRIGEQDLHVHPERNVLLQCLGGPVPPRLLPASSAPLQRGDVLLLCSDGLWGHMGEYDIARELAADNLEAALTRLVERAVVAGGRHGDNVSAIALAWDEDAPAVREPVARVKDARGGWAFPHVPDGDIPGAIEELRRALHRRGRDALDMDLGDGEPPPRPEEEFLRMSDEDVAREVERIRETYRRMYPPKPSAVNPAAAGDDEEYQSMSDEEIERAIARIRVAFRSAYPEPTAPSGTPADDYLSMTDDDIERAIERIRAAFRRGAAS